MWKNCPSVCLVHVMCVLAAKMLSTDVKVNKINTFYCIYFTCADPMKWCKTCTDAQTCSLLQRYLHNVLLLQPITLHCFVICYVIRSSLMQTQKQHMPVHFLQEYFTEALQVFARFYFILFYICGKDNDWVKKCMEYEVEGARPRDTNPMWKWPTNPVTHCLVDCMYSIIWAECRFIANQGPISVIVLVQKYNMTVLYHI